MTAAQDEVAVVLTVLVEVTVLMSVLVLAAAEAEESTVVEA